MSGWTVVAWVWGGSAALFLVLAVWGEVDARRRKRAAERRYRVSRQVARLTSAAVCVQCQLAAETGVDVGAHSYWQGVA